jgi:hypothetical protein
MKMWITFLLLSAFGYAGAQPQGMWASDSSPAIAKPVVGVFDELVELYPDTRLDAAKRTYSVDVARGTIASAHLMLTGLQGTQGISFMITGPDGKPAPGARWCRMIDVPVTENTGLDRCTEKFTGAVNPYVIRRAPFRIFDPFEPVTSPLVVDSSVLALRLELPVDSTVAPGQYVYKIRLNFASDADSVEFVVRVHHSLVPPTSRSTISYINWHTLDNVCKDHGVEKWSEPFWKMLETYARVMVRGRQNTFWFQWADFFAFDSSGTVVKFERELLKRYVETFLNAGMRTIHGAPIARRRVWGSSEMLLNAWLPQRNDVPAASADGKRILSVMESYIVTTMRENGWEKQWLQGIFDEPEDEFVDRYKLLAELLRKQKPDLQILEATMTVNLSGVVSVWCPQVQEYQAHREFFDGRKAAGDRVWVYTCLAPGGPWLNRLCDQERLRQVYIGWACARFDLQGFLHWGLNSHSGKPFEVLVRRHSETEFLPAGDSHILYPRFDGPLSSHRFEAHRIGMEDFELLSQLKSRNPQRAQQIIEKVFQAFDQYSKDVLVYREAKSQLLDALDY